MEEKCEKGTYTFERVSKTFHVPRKIKRADPSLLGGVEAVGIISPSQFRHNLFVLHVPRAAK